MADQADVVSAGLINQESLREAYNFIARTLSANGVRCTAAFVTAFAVGPSAIFQHLKILNELQRLVPSWYALSIDALKKGHHDGWDGRDVYQQFAQDAHELAWHGTTHLLLDDTTPSAAVELELELNKQLAADLIRQPTSIVFPRNRIGQLSALQGAGFKAYRAAKDQGKLGRASSLVRELHCWDSDVSAQPAHDRGMLVCPPGHFLNWPAGARAWVPASITIKRWKSLLRAAVERGGHVHMWFHPHNLITAPAMRHTFSALMNEVGNLARSRELSIMTMLDYRQVDNAKVESELP